jgi:hypothetical protein
MCIGVGEVALERLVSLLRLGVAPKARRLRLGPGDDRGPDVGLERDMDVTLCRSGLPPLLKRSQAPR